MVVLDFFSQKQNTDQRMSGSVSEMDAEFSVESSDAGSVNSLTSFFLSCM